MTAKPRYQHSGPSRNVIHSGKAEKPLINSSAPLASSVTPKIPSHLVVLCMAALLESKKGVRRWGVHQEVCATAPHPSYGLGGYNGTPAANRWRCDPHHQWRVPRSAAWHCEKEGET